MLLHVSLKPSWSCKGVQLFQIYSHSEDAECGYGTLAVVQWCYGLFGLIFILTYGKKWWKMIFYSTLHQQAFGGRGLKGFSRRPLFSLHPLQRSTKSTCLKMKPVLLSSHGRVCGTGNLTESQSVLSWILQPPISYSRNTSLVPSPNPPWEEKTSMSATTTCSCIFQADDISINFQVPV